MCQLMCPERRICLLIFKKFSGEIPWTPLPLRPLAELPLPLLMAVQWACSVFCHLCMSAEFDKRFLALKSRGWGKEGEPPTSSSPGPTPFCPTNANLLLTPLFCELLLHFFHPYPHHGCASVTLLAIPCLPHFTFRPTSSLWHAHTSRQCIPVALESITSAVPHLSDWPYTMTYAQAHTQTQCIQAIN